MACRERLDSYRRALENQARATLRRHHIRVPPRADVQEWVKIADTARLPAGERAILLATLQAAQAVKARVEDLTAQITQRVAHVPEVRLLLTLTGVGLLTAATIWARLGDPHRFSGPKQVGRYAGLDPSVDQSGQRDRRGRITRHGDGLLRRMLIEAAWSAARHDTGSLGRFYRRKVEQLGGKRPSWLWHGSSLSWPGGCCKPENPTGPASPPWSAERSKPCGACSASRLSGSPFAWTKRSGRGQVSLIRPAGA